MKPCLRINLGRMPYKECLDLQHKVLMARQQNRIPDCLLVVEHDNVFTIGRSGKKDNLLVPQQMLDETQISCISIERGGDITYHGPGQLVIYPIFALETDEEKKSFSAVDFINALEDMMIYVLGEYGITGEKNLRNRGVWVKESKVGFVGIAVKQNVSFHGLALNISPDLKFFKMINPCGMTHVKITSMEKEKDRKINFSDTADIAMTAIENKFELSLETMPVESFKLLLEAECYEHQLQC